MYTYMFLQLCSKASVCVYIIVFYIVMGVDVAVPLDYI